MTDPSGSEPQKPQQYSFKGVAEKKQFQRPEARRTEGPHNANAFSKNWSINPPEEGITSQIATQYVCTEWIFIIRVNRCNSFSFVLVITNVNQPKSLPDSCQVKRCTKNQLKKVLVIAKTPCFRPVRSRDQYCVVTVPLRYKTPSYGPMGTRVPPKWWGGHSPPSSPTHFLKWNCEIKKLRMWNPVIMHVNCMQLTCEINIFLHEMYRNYACKMLPSSMWHACKLHVKLRNFYMRD